ncbi:TetR/AcrR family transcriptional regulator [Methylocella sp.]|uniref:TetR/AcrR family transcriptional regulator n=1 Tax=Methylocella sp. TaxID=1978226 RepID=UPI00378522E9
MKKPTPPAAPAAPAARRPDAAAGETRERLLACGEALARSRGFNGFSYADLAAAVGVRTASIHYHFPTKADLGLALVARYDARYDAAMEAIARETPDAARRVRAYAGLYLKGLEDNLGCLCAVLAASPDVLSLEMRAAVAAFFEKHVVWLARVIEQGRADGTARPGAAAEPLARAIICLLEGALMMERLFDAHGFPRNGGASGARSFEGALAAVEREIAP